MARSNQACKHWRIDLPLNLLSSQKHLRTSHKVIRSYIPTSTKQKKRKLYWDENSSPHGSPTTRVLVVKWRAQTEAVWFYQTSIKVTGPYHRSLALYTIPPIEISTQSLCGNSPQISTTTRSAKVKTQTKGANTHE